MVARLPSELDLGPLSSPFSNRPIATIDTTGYAKGAAALAEGTKNLGQGITSGANSALSGYYAEQQQLDGLDVAKANSLFQVSHAGIDADFYKSDDANPESRVAAYNEQSKQAADEAAAQIRNPLKRQEFQLKTDTAIANGAKTQSNQATDLAIKQNQSWVLDQGAKVINQAVIEPDPVKRKEYIDAHRALVDNMPGTNALQKREIMQTWTQTYAKTYADTCNLRGDCLAINDELKRIILDPLPSQLPATGTQGTYETTPPGGPQSVAVRNNNPGNQWMGTSARLFGADKSENVSARDQPAIFPDKVTGAGAMFHLLGSSGYAGKTIEGAIYKWANGTDPSYPDFVEKQSGVPRDTVITPEFLKSPQVIAVTKAMSRWEAGHQKGDYPLTDEGWKKAQEIAFDPAARQTYVDGLKGGKSSSSNPFPVDAALTASQSAEPGVVHAVTDQTERVQNVRGFGAQLTGAITVNGNTYKFINGGGGRGSIPFGEYSVGNFRTAQQRSEQGLTNLGDTFDLSDVSDPLAKDTRTELRIHRASGNGTLGCIGIVGGQAEFDKFQRDVKAAGVTKIVLGPGDQQTAGGGNVKVASLNTGTASDAGPQASAPAGPQYAQNVTPSRPGSIFDVLDPASRISVADGVQKNIAATTLAAEKMRIEASKAQADEFLKEAHSRADKGTLTSDYVESIRPGISPENYKNLLATVGNKDQVDDVEAIVDLAPRIDRENPDTFQKSAAQYVRDGKLKTSTYIALTEKNRAASKDDQPASPYRSGRELVKVTLDPGQLLSGAAAAVARSSQAQAMTEYDNFAQANPRASREELLAESQNIIKRYQIVPFDQMKLAIGTSKYFDGKGRSDIQGKDIDAAEEKLATDIAGGKLTKPQQEFEIRLLTNWRAILDNEQRAAEKARQAKEAAGGRR